MFYQGNWQVLCMNQDFSFSGKLVVQHFPEKHTHAHRFIDGWLNSQYGAISSVSGAGA